MSPQRCKRFKPTPERESFSRPRGFGGYEYKYNTTDTDDDTTARDLTWRADPEHSLSDWTIELTCEDGSEREVTSLHTHKCVLAAGKYRSDYFRGIFQSANTMRETNTSTSTISLKASSFEAFPEMLDHIYTGTCGIKTENAVAMLFLSNYFGIPTLFRDAKMFIERDMEISNAHTYLTEAATYQDDVVLDEAKVMCAERLDSLSVEQTRNLSPDLLKLVLGEDKLNISSANLSLLVADYCRHHPDFVNGNLLADITNGEVMPHIHPSEALFFLNLSVKHQSVTCHISGDENGLRARCIQAIHDWKVAFGSSILSEKNDKVSPVPDGYFNLPDPIKVEVVEEALRLVKREVSQLWAEVEWLKEQHASNSEAHARQLSYAELEVQRLNGWNSQLNNQMSRLKQQHEQECKSLKQKHEQECKFHRMRLAHQGKECRSLRKQLAKARNW